MINNYYKKHRKALQKACERYQNVSEEEKEGRWKKAWDRYQNLSEEEKEKKRQYHHELNKNISEEQKQVQLEYMINFLSTHKKWLFCCLIRFIWS